MLDQFVGKVLAEKYRIDSVMRDTDLGRIYHGTHLLMDKNVAVKVLSPALAVDESIVNRFSREARAVSNISHPNLLNVTDFGSDADDHCAGAHRIARAFRAADRFRQTLINGFDRSLADEV